MNLFDVYVFLNSNKIREKRTVCFILKTIYRQKKTISKRFRWLRFSVRWNENCEYNEGNLGHYRRHSCQAVSRNGKSVAGFALGKAIDPVAAILRAKNWSAQQLIRVTVTQSTTTLFVNSVLQKSICTSTRNQKVVGFYVTALLKLITDSCPKKLMNIIIVKWQCE